LPKGNIARRSAGANPGTTPRPNASQQNKGG
jgi:hypothetical protein